MTTISFAQELTSKNQDTLLYKYPYEILVSAPRITSLLKNLPFATSVVYEDRLKLSMSKTINVEEALKLVPGVKIDNQADGSRVHLSIRGQGILSERGIRGIKVLLDGLPLNDPSGFTPDFYDVDWATVNKIEVLRGPSGSLFGGSSSGGVINILTQDGYDKNFGGELSSSYGTYNFWKAFGQIGGKVENFDYRFSVSRMMGDGYRVHTRYWADNFYGKLKYTTSENISIQPVIYYTDFFNENPEGLNIAQVAEDPTQANPDAVPKNEFMETKRFSVGTVSKFLLNENSKIDVTAFVRSTKYTESVPSSVIHRSYSTPGGSVQYSLMLSTNNLRHTFSIGSDIQFQTVDEYKRPNLGGAIEDSKIYQSNQIMKQRGTGAFLIYNLLIDEKLSVMLSSRYDNIHNELEDKLKDPFDLSDKKDYEKFTSRIGITYSPFNNFNLYANWGQGFTPPAIEELANNPYAFGGFNNQLTYAQSNGAELGVRGYFNDAKLNYDLAFFYLNTQNDFDRFRTPDRPLETFYRNTDSFGNAIGSNRVGIETYIEYLLCKEVEVRAAYTYSVFKYALKTPLKIIMDDPTIVKYSKDGNFLPNSPEHQAFIDIQYDILSNFNVGISSEIYSRSYIDGANIDKESVPGFALWNFRVAYDMKIQDVSCELNLFGKNIFSKKWIAFTEPDPGGNSYQPGTPFEIFGGIKIKF